MPWQGKNVLVTGGGGFIGSHLCEELVQMGANLTALVRYNSGNRVGNLEEVSPELKSAIDIVGGDITDPFLVREITRGKDVVFHLAALVAIPYSYFAPHSYVRTNVEGTMNVLEACRINQVPKLVHTSTSETYGTAQYTPIDEKHPLVGQSPYSASKIAADKMVESYHLAYNLPVATIRPFNTFGPRQSLRAVIPTIVTQALRKNEVRLGSVEPVRDFNYVKDTVAGFIKVAEAEACLGKVTNIGSGTAVSVGRVVEIIQSLLQKPFAVIQEAERKRPLKSEVFNLICNNQQARERTGWEPAYSLEQGLEKTIEYFKTKKIAKDNYVV
ncbi:MAG: GDP-mannose 4,6-dehydratase [Carboxydocellales bacterium]